ncbi:hypothetical protein PMAYCL1PPCAC_13420, partial [Pristionchus mayeri]
GTIVHEIAHSIGLGHTHMRSDRDAYVTINYNNMVSGQEKNYDMLSTNNNFGVEYDYSSVLHYPGNANAVNEKVPVITAKDPFAQQSMGQREKAAFSDVKMVNLFYNCAQKCPSPSVKCQNGGIINSKTCNTCICPHMFTGSDCSQRTPSRGKYASPSCGADLTATSASQNVKGTFGSYYDQYWANDGETACYWNFKAPAGRKIEIRVNKVSNMWCDDGCGYSRIEFFTKGFVNGGYRFCCDEPNGKVFQSSDNGVSIKLTASWGNPLFDVDYRLI